jgi:hypothetical protein
MTLSIAWARQSGSAHELAFASDRQLCGGAHVDRCQKAFSLPRAAIAATFLIASTAQSVAAPANTLTELWRELNTCIRTPSVDVGSELTIVFALKRDGSLFGLPRIAHSHLLGEAEAQRAFVAAAIGAVARCLPVEITEGLGAAIAGRPLSIRIGGRPARDV